jgi:SAM-dependent methyltransferase
MLAPDGRCRTFSADAQGYGRGEGCGLLVLELLSDALRNGRDIIAVIRGSAINQDGASSGLTVPNGRAQQAVIQAALEAARIDPKQVDYLECHGTGTPLGDPIEVHAAAAVYGSKRARPLLIGSVKTNVGHLEAAAGVAAICKTTLALREGEIPAHLHFGEPNPHIAWSELPVSVVSTRQVWPSIDGPRRAGVSSFGASGTNVHVILEQAPMVLQQAEQQINQTECILALSAHSGAALRELVIRYRDFLAASPPDMLHAICYSAATGRSHLKHRLAATGDYDAILARLRGVDTDRSGIAQRYEAGEDIDWNAYFRNSGLARVPLPVYPFQRRPYWPQQKATEEANNSRVRMLLEGREGDLAQRIARSVGVEPELAAKVLGELARYLKGADTEEHWYHRIEWRTQPVWSARADFFPALCDVVRSAATNVAARFAHAQPDYERLLMALDRAAGAYARAAIQRIESGTIAPTRLRLFERSKEMAEAAAGGADAKTLLAEIRGKWPAAKTETVLLERCGEALADTLRGLTDPNVLLFPGGGQPGAEDLYHNAPGARVMNGALAATVSALCAEVPEWRRVRVLEIGAGTGSATASILDQLPRDRTEYVYSDVSAGFFGRAKTRFAGHDFIRYQTFDVEQPGILQGFEPGSFDLVVASNVIHATRDVAVVLRNVAELLSPGGMLVLLEGIQGSPFTDLIFGLTDGWWSFEDHQLRPNHPLLSREKWLDILGQSGFDDCAGLLPDQAGDLFVRQTILMARRAVDLARRSRIIFAGIERIMNDASATVVRAGAEFRWTGQHQLELDPRQPEHFQRLFEIAPADEIVYCQDFDAPACCASLLHIAQHAPSARLFILTRGAQAAGASGAPSFAYSTLWGLGATLDLERPDLPCFRIDLDPSGEPDRNDRFVAAELSSRDGEPMVAYRRGKRFAARLVSDRAPASRRPSIDGSGSWLITGGMRGLGFFTAEWLAERGARHIALLGRKAPDDYEQDRIARLRQGGVRVETFRADVSCEEELRTVLQGIRSTMPPLTGVIHSAGLLADGMIADQSASHFDAVFAPKVVGAWNLHRLTAQDRLTHFVLYSTGVSLIGSPGQSNHTAANAFLNALADHRRSQGLAGLSLAWGRWSEIGSAAHVAVEIYTRKRGFQSISPERGRLALDDLFFRQGTIAVMAADWRVVASQFSAGTPPLFSVLVEQGKATVAGQSVDLAATARETLACASQAEKELRAGQYLREGVRQILGLDALPPLDMPLTEMGLDSLVSTELRNRLLHDLKIDVPMKSLLSGVSLRQLRAVVLESLLLASVTESERSGTSGEAVEEFRI